MACNAQKTAAVWLTGGKKLAVAELDGSVTATSVFSISFRILMRSSAVESGDVRPFNHSSVMVSRSMDRDMVFGREAPTLK